jgi:hypothetical protein
VEQAAAPVQDSALASTVRRVMTKDLIARRGRALLAVAVSGVALAGSLAGCAATRSTQAEPAPITRSVPVVAPSRRAIAAQGQAYDHYVISQMEARAGRMPQAIAELHEAIKADPTPRCCDPARSG